MKGKVLRFFIASGLAVSILVAGPPVKGAGVLQIGGVGVFASDCGGMTSYFTIEMAGSLTGCWYTDIPVSSITPSGVYQERGTELFVGWLTIDGVPLGFGSFRTTYKFTGKFAPTGEEIHGRCEHQIVAGSGTGVFEDATGRLDFKDDVENAIFLYRGHLALP
jgi:hypothetical protein